MLKKAVDFCAELSVKQAEGSGRAPYYKFLENLMRLLKPERAIELGVYEGVGLSYMAQGCPETAILACDIEIRREARLRATGKNITFHKRDSLDLLRDVAKRPGLIHVDTIHEPEHVAKEYALSCTVIGTPGVICIDDVLISEEMEEWWKSVQPGVMPGVSNIFKATYPELHETGYGVIGFE